MLASSKSPVPTVRLAVNITAFAPGSACGQRCVISPAAESSLVSGAGEPPADGTRDRPTRASSATKSVPSSAQLPKNHRRPSFPPACGSITSVIGGAAGRSRFSSACRRRRTRSTGRQVKRIGSRAPSVAASGEACNWSSRRDVELRSAPECFLPDEGEESPVRREDAAAAPPPSSSASRRERRVRTYLDAQSRRQRGLRNRPPRRPSSEHERERQGQRTRQSPGHGPTPG